MTWYPATQRWKVNHVLLGGNSVGKTSLAKLFTESSDDSTSAVSTGVQKMGCLYTQMSNEGELITVAVHDIPFNPLFRTITKSTAQQAHVIWFVFSFIDPGSLEIIIDRELPGVKDLSSKQSLQVILIGTHMDMLRKGEVIEESDLYRTAQELVDQDGRVVDLYLFDKDNVADALEYFHSVTHALIIAARSAKNGGDSSTVLSDAIPVHRSKEDGSGSKKGCCSLM